jgi:hypothetical protein
MHPWKACCMSRDSCVFISFLIFTAKLNCVTITVTPQLKARARYIKEDLILPHDITFHWLIETRARGKSGPLYVLLA